jgi:hypothetical protein
MFDLVHPSIDLTNILPNDFQLDNYTLLGINDDYIVLQDKYQRHFGNQLICVLSTRTFEEIFIDTHRSGNTLAKDCFLVGHLFFTRAKYNATIDEKYDYQHFVWCQCTNIISPTTILNLHTESFANLSPFCHTGRPVDDIVGVHRHLDHCYVVHGSGVISMYSMKIGVEEKRFYIAGSERELYHVLGMAVCKSSILMRLKDKSIIFDCTSREYYNTKIHYPFTGSTYNGNILYLSVNSDVWMVDMETQKDLCSFTLKKPNPSKFVGGELIQHQKNVIYFLNSTGNLKMTKSIHISESFIMHDGYWVNSVNKFILRVDLIPERGVTLLRYSRSLLCTDLTFNYV